MANTALSIEGYSIVGIGSFNPAILHPAWFELVGLLGKGESVEAQTEVCTPQITVFESKGWLRIEALPERVSFRTKDASQVERLRDLFVGTFDVLAHTPISAIGLNSHLAYSPDTREARHKIGHAIAPKVVWKGALTLPGMRSLVVEDPRLDKEFPGKLRVEIAARHNMVIGIDFNDHYDIQSKNAESAAKVVSARWLKSTQDATVIAETVMKNALNTDLSPYEIELIAEAARLEAKAHENN